MTPDRIKNFLILLQINTTCIGGLFDNIILLLFIYSFLIIFLVTVVSRVLHVSTTRR